MGVVILNGKRLQMMACYYGFEKPVFEIIKDGLFDLKKDIIRKRIGVF